MITRRIRLREVTSEDWPTIFSWRNTESFRFYVRSNDGTVDYNEFLCEFSQAALKRPFQFMVEALERGEPIGLAYVHSTSDDGTRCFLNIYIVDRYVGRGYGVDVCALISHFLLSTNKYSQVCVQAFSYNTFSLSALRGANIPKLCTDEVRHHAGKEHRTHRFYISHDHADRLNKLLEALRRPKGTRLSDPLARQRIELTRDGGRDKGVKLARDDQGQGTTRKY